MDFSTSFFAYRLESCFDDFYCDYWLKSDCIFLDSVLIRDFGLRSLQDSYDSLSLKDSRDLFKEIREYKTIFF